MKKKLIQCIRQGGVLEVVDITEINASSHTFICCAAYCPSYRLLRTVNRCKETVLLPLFFCFSTCLPHGKHTCWLFPFKGYLPKISLAEPPWQCLLMWSRWNHAHWTLSLPEMDWNTILVISKGKVKKGQKKNPKKIKIQWWGGRGKSQWARWCLLSPSQWCLSLMCVHTHIRYFTLWHSLLEEFSGLSCFWRLYHL